jgi:hypothetical protein
MNTIRFALSVLECSLESLAKVCGDVSVVVLMSFAVHHLAWRLNWLDECIAETIYVITWLLLFTTSYGLEFECTNAVHKISS